MPQTNNQGSANTGTKLTLEEYTNQFEAMAERAQEVVANYRKARANPWYKRILDHAELKIARNELEEVFDDITKHVYRFTKHYGHEEFRRIQERIKEIHGENPLGLVLLLIMEKKEN